MTVSYNKLWKILIDRNINKTQMRLMAGISANVLAKMGRNETISMDSLCKIAEALHCGFDDIVEISSKEK